MNDYVDIQKALNVKARSDYKALMPSLDPRVREILLQTDRETGKKCLAMGDKFKGNHTEEDAAVLPEASVRPDMAGAMDGLSDFLEERFRLTPVQAAGIVAWVYAWVAMETEKRVAIMLARTLGTLLRVDNLKQEVYALLYATGTAAANGLGSMRKTAQLILKPDGNPVSVASLSKRACWWVGFLGLPPGDGMKSDKAVTAYVDSARTGHATRRNSKMQKALNRLDKTAA